MKRKIQILMALLVFGFLFYKLYVTAQDCFALRELYETDNVILHSQFAITHGDDSEWYALGAKDITVNYESGRKEFIFNDFRALYQAYDEREDILGTVIGPKTGNEPIRIDMQISSDLYLSSIDFQRNLFSLYSKFNIYGDVYFIDGKPIGQDIDFVSEDEIQQACSMLIHSIDEFEAASEKIFVSAYAEKKEQLQIRLIIYGIVLIFWGICKTRRRLSQ